MSLRETLESIRQNPSQSADRKIVVDVPSRGRLEVSARSIAWIESGAVMVGRSGQHRRLLLVDLEGGSGLVVRFSGEKWSAEPGVECCCGELDHHNAVAVREVYEIARPRPLGLDNSFGLGDRLGVAGPAHLRARSGSGFKPVLAQQSIRELERTDRSPDEVMDAATWAVLEEGWTDAWGADADHLKTPEDVERMAAAGFTMFTIDPGDHVVDAADEIDAVALEGAFGDLPWDDLEESPAGALARYRGTALRVGSDLVLEPENVDVHRAWVKYGASLAHAARMYHHIAATMGEKPFEVEVSVDETASVTSDFEHLLVATELRRLGVEWVGLAPRFVGHFEKGIDYRGDLELFRREYLKHLAIADALGPYKISIHSGSDKFSVYKVIGDIGTGGVHVKTAGTSYLEALRTIASCEPRLFREILDFSRSLYEHERRTYHVSAQLERVPAATNLGDDDLAALFDDEDARQVLHVTFGRVLTEKTPGGAYLFKDRVLTALATHEGAHFENLVAHFRRHTAPFGRVGRETT